jgi:serine protease AprX
VKTSIKIQAQITLCVMMILSEVVSAQSSSLQRTWIFFRDKLTSSLALVNPIELGISPRALHRRAKVLPPDRLVDELDLPVRQEYLDQLRMLGVSIHGTSRWMNAVSVKATPEQLLLLQTQPYVSAVKQVMVCKRPQPEMFSIQQQPPLMKAYGGGLNYGSTLIQHTRTKVVDVHALGITGSGVLLGMGDDGFNNHTVHVALKNIPIVAEYDFVQRDSNTSRSPYEYASQGNHGANTLSIAAGYADGSLIGAAFGVSVVLAKTEIDSVEIHLEEDNYVEGLEWMERLGVDIVSTSLGYDNFLSPGYDPDDIQFWMKNGRTGKTSTAASIAARKGVLLVTAMGNEGWYRKDSTWSIVQTGQTGSLITPADADSILSVGAANSDGMLASFSSTGPTADGRTKPEIVNQGVNVFHVNSATVSDIAFGSGTSYATPLTAGAAALVLSAHPELTPMQIREAIINTAQKDILDSRNGSLTYPNNYYGWGHVNALDAVLYWGLVFSNHPTITLNDSVYAVSTKIKSTSPLTTDSLFLFHKKALATLFQRVPLLPTGITDEYAASVMKTEMDSTSIGYFSARDNSGMKRTNPFSTRNASGDLIDGPQVQSSVPSKFSLNNFPNPFNPSTTIVVESHQREEAEIAVFNILGQLVKTLFHGVVDPGTRHYRWDGIDERGVSVAAGVYIVRLKTNATLLSTKLILLK